MSQQAENTALGALPIFESLKYETKVEEGAGRATRPDIPPLEEGGNDPDEDRKSDFPWGQGIWEDDASLPGVQQGDDYTRDRDEMHDALKHRIVWDARGGRSIEGANKRKYSAYVKRAHFMKYV